VAVGDRSSLNQLFEALREALADNGIHYTGSKVYRDFRPGDVRHSQADVSKAQRLLGYAPSHEIRQGIEAAMPWYITRLGGDQALDSRLPALLQKSPHTTSV
jgi:UDP-N-acetylglucosamine 4-epimerase